MEFAHSMKFGGTHVIAKGESKHASSSNAYQQVVVLLDQLFQMLGYSFANRRGIAFPRVLLYHLLRQAGFVNATYSISPVNLGGWENAAGRAYCRLLLNATHELKPFFLAHKRSSCCLTPVASLISSVQLAAKKHRE